MRLKALRLEADVRAFVQASFSKDCERKIESLRMNELSEVENLRAAVQFEINYFARRLLSEYADHSWVIRFPLTQTVFVARWSRILILIPQSSGHTSQVFHCDSQLAQEALLDFLKRNL